ncbi:hypothetical protein LTR12_012848 [Friedmanniomyces endolithicus]|nr:hypothetical protein LTR74_010679 [Friedmanniomyces endolithicus]KAK1812754.1 hypothetical protein LTR12_012848 [Friedmanniomyces endolithicus]
MSQAHCDSRETYRALLAMAIRSLPAFLTTQFAAPKKQSMAEQYNQAPDEAGAEDGSGRMNISYDDHPTYPQTPGDEAMVDLSAQMNDVEMCNDEVGLVRYYASDGEDSDGGEPDRDSDSDYPSETDENNDLIEDDEASDKESSDSEASDGEESGKDLSDEEMIEIDRSNVIGHGNGRIREDDEGNDEDLSDGEMSYEEVIGVDRGNVISHGNGTIRDRLRVDWSDPATIEMARDYMERYGPGSLVRAIEMTEEESEGSQSDEDEIDVNEDPPGSSDGPREDYSVFHHPPTQMRFGHRVERMPQSGRYDIEEVLRRFLQWASAYSILVLRERILNVSACVDEAGELELRMEILMQEGYPDGPPEGASSNFQLVPRVVLWNGVQGLVEGWREL